MNRTLVKALTIVFGVAVGIGMLTTTVNASDSKNNPFSIAQIYSHPLNKSYGQWAATWWKWVLEVPASTSPAFGTGNCEDGQSGDVWFLMGTFGSDPVRRNCTIPEGKSLFFPLINVAYFAFQSDPPETRTCKYAKSRAVCPEVPGDLVINAKIDGIAVKGETNYYEQSPCFDVQLAEENIFGLTGNDLLLSPSADSGYYLFLQPLKPGKHSIEWTAHWTCGKDVDGNDVIFNQDIHYDINVKRH